MLGFGKLFYVSRKLVNQTQLFINNNIHQTITYMNSRRKFIKQSTAFALGSMLLSRLANSAPFTPSASYPPIGLQLFTLEQLMQQDPRGTLQKIAAIGYKELECSFSPKGTYYGFKPKELATFINDLGMHWRSQLVLGAPLNLGLGNALYNPKTSSDSLRVKQMIDSGVANVLSTLQNDCQQLVDEAAAGGVEYLVCAAIPLQTVHEFKRAADILNKSGEACRKAGIQLAYHNHQFEFDEVEGQRSFDYLLNNTDKDLVKMELDLGWVAYAKQDPVELFKKHPGRFPLWHVKDVKKTNEFVVVGTGDIDFKRIFKYAKESGMKYYFLEQEGATPATLEDMADSYTYLKKITG
jgi:sugar phosphate isomerase/epimerase